MVAVGEVTPMFYTRRAAWRAGYFGALSPILVLRSPNHSLISKKFELETKSPDASILIIHTHRPPGKQAMASRFWFALPVLILSGLAPTNAQTQKAYPDQAIHAPTPVPDRIILTFDGDPTTSQAVTWRTNTSVKTACAQIAIATEGPEFDPTLGRNPAVNTKRTQSIPATSTKLTTDLSEALYHSVTFSSLEPKTKYVYRVGDGTNWSEWHQFRTASPRPEPFGFIYFGDSQNDLKRHWSRVARGAFSDMPKAAFIIHAGDLINTPHTDAEWGEWHTAAGWINGTVPSIPTPGNHEYWPKRLTTEQINHFAQLAAIGGSIGNPTLKDRPTLLTEHWRAQFTLPTNGPAGLHEAVYYFDYQGVRFISLNSNEKQVEQVPWLEQVLSSNPHRWSVVTFHHPIYSPTKGRDNKELRNRWRPIFDKYAVDLVLTGHDHTYGRTGLMREDNTLSGAQMYAKTGTVYCVSVSGPKLYEVGTQNVMVNQLQKKQLYQLVQIDGDRLHYEARSATGELNDEFELRKQSSGRNILVEQSELNAERNRGTGFRMNGRDTTFAAGGMVAVAAGAWGIRRIFRRRDAITPR
jgi:3',5'-cyclic AMP phosphodiesterase CpdA